MQYIKLNDGQIKRYNDSATMVIHYDKIYIDDEECKDDIIMLVDIAQLDTKQYKMKLSLDDMDRYYGGI